MCGITGVLYLNRQPVSEQAVAKMSATLPHRGPDSNGVWVNEYVGLGHRRLAIIDLSPNGHQPMESETGDLVIVYNGELYNFQD